MNRKNTHPQKHFYLCVKDYSELKITNTNGIDNSESE